MDIDFEQYNVGMPRGGTVVLADHDTRWTACFDVISGSMAAGLEPFEIEIHHVGSTAVPNIKAKPILDVLCIADVIEAFDALRHRMEEMDFVWKGEYGIPGRRYCVRYNREQTVSYVHLHAFRRGHPAVEEHLLFRDYLRARPEKAQQYESLKRTLAEKFASDRKNYTDGKDTLIKTLIQEARTWKDARPSAK